MDQKEGNSTKPTLDDRLISMGDLARILRRSERTIRRRIEQGNLPRPFSLGGGQKFWTLPSLERFMEERQDQAMKQAAQELAEENHRKGKLGLSPGLGEREIT